MTVRFGTDGIRGRASDEITVDLAYRLGRAVATVFSVPDLRRVRHARKLTDARGCGARGTSRRRSERCQPRLLHDAGRCRHRPTARWCGRGRVGVAQSLLRQRAEGARRRRREARSRDRSSRGECARDASKDQATRTLRSSRSTCRPNTSTSSTFASSRQLTCRDCRIVVDCAHGAASHVAHELFASTGADVTVIHDQPDGRNINEDAGSTHVGRLIETVRELDADLGLAVDGDADRLIAIDSEGTVRDGDDLMVLFALDRAARGVLGGGIAVTSMSNLGLNRALQRRGYRDRRDGRRGPQRPRSHSKSARGSWAVSSRDT